MAWQRDHNPFTRRAPRSLWLAAGLLDLLLAFSAALLVRLLVRGGVLGTVGLWYPGMEGAWIDKQLVLLGLLLWSLRDVPGSASPAKWLFCMRVVNVDGEKPSLFQRLLRVPWSVLPVAWVFRRIEAHMPWRVVTYAPGVWGLATRSTLMALAAAVTIGVTVESLRPSIGRGDAMRLVQSLIHDPILRRQLGEPLDYQIRRVLPRSRRPGHDRARFRLQVRGAELQQDMVVQARKVDGTWAVEEVLDIDIRRLRSEENGPVASR